MGFKLKNVADRLKEIAETNDSEDVARAIKTVSAYSFKDRLAEMENASVYETPGDDDDQYCANCGNTGYSLATTGEKCPNCSDEEGETENKDEAWNRIADRVDAREGGVDDDAELAQMGKNAGLEETGDDEETGSALDRVIDRCKRSGEGGPIDRVVDRVASRNSDGLGDDPWGIGEGDEDAGVPDDIQMGQEEGPRDRIHDRVEARGGVGGQGLGEDGIDDWKEKHDTGEGDPDEPGFGEEYNNDADQEFDDAVTRGYEDSGKRFGEEPVEEDEAGHPLPSPNDGYEGDVDSNQILDVLESAYDAIKNGDGGNSGEEFADVLEEIADLMKKLQFDGGHI